MSAHRGNGAVHRAALELRRYGSLRVESHYRGLWISPAWNCWTELFELDGRVAEANRAAGVTYDPRTLGHGVSS